MADPRPSAMRSQRPLETPFFEPHGSAHSARQGIPLSRWYGVRRATEDFPKEHPGEHYVAEEYAASSEISAVALEAIMAHFSQRLDSLSGQISDLSTQFTGLSQKLRELTNNVSELEETVTERPIVRLAFLSNLSSGRYKVSSPFPVVLEEYDDQTLARWPEVEATGAGASELEAIAMLKQDIVALYEDLRSTPRSELGGAAATALSVLNSVIRRKRG